jgi:hypothetical protein
MHRIDSATADANKHGTGKDGFQDPSAGAPTATTADWFDAVQEEVAAPIEASGITLVKGTNNQLLQVLQRMGIATWSFQDEQTLGAAAAMNGIAYGDPGGSTLYPGGIFTAVGEDAQFVWERGSDQAIGTTATFNAICRGPGNYWIAVGEVEGGDAEIVTWEDSDFFTERTAPVSDTAAALNCIATDGSSHVVALGDHDGTDLYCVRSTDGGASWTEVAITGGASDYITAVCWGNSQYVAAGWDNTASAPAFWTSSDGSSWTKRSAHASSSEVPVGITWTGSAYVAVSAEEVYTSADGITWTNATPWTAYNGGLDVKGVASCPDTGLVVVVGKEAPGTKVPRAGGGASFDHGASWEVIPGIPHGARDVAYGGGRFAVVLDDSAAPSARLAYSMGVPGA